MRLIAELQPWIMLSLACLGALIGHKVYRDSQRDPDEERHIQEARDILAQCRRGKR